MNVLVLVETRVRFFPSHNTLVVVELYMRALPELYRAARPCPATAAAGATRTVGAQRGTTNEEALRRLD